MNEKGDTEKDKVNMRLFGGSGKVSNCLSNSVLFSVIIVIYETRFCVDKADLEFAV